MIPRKQVLIRPLWDMGLKGRLFETIYPWSMNRWREAAARLDIALDGWDVMPLDRADCVWLLDLPDTKAEFDDARRRARPGVPFVLHVMESPVGREHNFVPENQGCCDYVVTYQQNAAGQPNRFSYRLPHSLAFETDDVPFGQRRCTLMVNSNRVEGYFACRTPGVTGLPGVGRNLNGWKTPGWMWFQPARGELYSWRRKLARTAESVDPALLSVYGPGWNGERISWCPIFPRRPFRCRVGGFTPQKLRLAATHRFCISVENFRGRHDYISEKLFDPLVAGSVPVYLGDDRITDLIPKAAFVDVRDFRHHRDLLDYLRACPESEWQKMRDAGRSFLQTRPAREFSTDCFVARMNEILNYVLGRTPTVPSSRMPSP